MCCGSEQQIVRRKKNEKHNLGSAIHSFLSCRAIKSDLLQIYLTNGNKSCQLMRVP